MLLIASPDKPPEVTAEEGRILIRAGAGRRRRSPGGVCAKADKSPDRDDKAATPGPRAAEGGVGRFRVRSATTSSTRSPS